MKKRFLSAILASLVCLAMMPTSVFANEQLIGDENAIKDTVIVENESEPIVPECHMSHDENCGYVKAIVEVPCTHLLEDGTYSCQEADSLEDYVCQHTDECGYEKGIEGSECTHSCELCENVEVVLPEVLPETLEGEITEIITLSNDVLFQRAALDTLNLPDTLTGLVEGEEVQIPVTWDGQEAAKELGMSGGLASFQPVIQGDFSLATDVELPTISAMILGKGRMIGLGTEAFPLEIRTAEQLQEIAALVYWSDADNGVGPLEYLVFGTPELSQIVHMKLVNDIDISSIEWLPIGMGSESPFSEVFDGNGYTISGLHNMSEMGDGNVPMEYVGLFGTVYSGIIKNLAVETAQIDENAANPKMLVGDVVGIIAGVTDGDTVISNCYTTGMVQGETAGGIVGMAGVPGSGVNNTIIQNCYSFATVLADTDVAGGIVASAYSGTTIDTTYAAGMVDGQYVGGVIAGTMMSSSKDLEVAGGIVGELELGATVANSVSLHSIVEAADATINVTEVGGRIAGIADGTITNSYSTTGTSLPISGGSDGIALTSADFVLAVDYNPWVEKMGFTTEAWQFNTLKLPQLKTTAGNIFSNQNDELPDYVKTAEWLGDGTQANPFKISSEAGLRKLASQVDSGNGGAGINYDGQYFELTGDILLQKGQWEPIGASNRPFKGSFDGKNYTISGLMIETANSDYQGLFAYVEDGTIKNIKLENVFIDGRTGTVRSYVGSVAGYLSGTVENVHATGEIKAGSYTGGILGTLGTNAGSSSFVNSTVSNCSSKVNVVGGNYVGGLLGSAVPSDTRDSLSSNAININNSYSEDNTVEGGSIVGGLIGYLRGSVYSGNSSVASRLSKSYSTADVEGDNNVGGLVGYIIAPNTRAVLSDVYSVGDVYSSGPNTSAGGLVGVIDVSVATSSTLDAEVNIHRSYTAGNVTTNVSGSTARAGGIVGHVTFTDNETNPEPGVSIVNSMALNESLNGNITSRIANETNMTSGTNDFISFSNNRGLKSMAGVAVINDPGTDNRNGLNVDIGSITGEMNNKLSAPASATWGVTNDQNLANIKGVGQETVVRPEYLRNFNRDTEFKGDGTINNPYEIQNVEELILLADTVNIKREAYEGKYFKLTSDINLSDGQMSGVWNVIGSNDVNKFKGHFDGNNKTIKGLVSEPNSNSDYAVKGLFGYVENGSIKNLTLENVKVASINNKVGALAADIVSTSIENCHVSGVVVGETSRATDVAGGLVGSATGTKSSISYSTFKGNVDAIDYVGVGGLVGKSSNYSISYSSADATVKGAQAGGLVGGFEQTNEAIIIDSSYAAGEVVGDRYAGGLVGYVNSTDKGVIIKNSYAKSKVEGSENLAGIVASAVGTGNISIDNCYVTGTIDGDSSGDMWLGGIFAYADTSGDVTIKNCVVLSDSIYGESSNGEPFWGRIVSHDVDAKLENNYAFDGMEVNGDVIEDGEAVDGLSIIHDEFKFKSWWTDNAKFDDTVWSKDDMKLPIITSDKLVQQDPDLPIYLTNFVVLVDSNILGTLKFGEELTATIDSQNEKDINDLSYQWYRFVGTIDENRNPFDEANMAGREKIEGATEITYTTTVDDVDMYLYCEYKGKNHNYRDMAITEDMVIRADGPTATLPVDFSFVGDDANKLTRTLKEYQYSIDGGNTWTDCTDEKTDLSAVSGNINAANDILVRVKLTDTHFEGKTTVIDIVLGENADKVNPIYSTTGMSDGALGNVNIGMEYKPAGSSKWIAITGDTVENLAPGMYEVRYKMSKVSLPGAVYSYKIVSKGGGGGGGGGGGSTVEVGTPEIKVNGKVETNSKIEIAAGDLITIVGAQNGSKIYYTLDGTTPNKDSIEYEGPFEVEDGTTLKILEIGSRNSSIEVFKISVIEKTDTVIAVEGKVKLSENASTTRYMDGLTLTEFGIDKPIARLRVLKSISNLLTFDLPKETPLSTFTDVSELDRELIGKLQASGIIVGKGDGTLGANDALTRAEFAVIACNILGILPEQGVAFADTTDHWANGYLMALKNRGFITGYEDGTGRPDSYLTAAEFVSMTNQIAGINVTALEEKPSETVYSDVKGHWAEKAISAVIK